MQWARCEVAGAGKEKFAAFANSLHAQPISNGVTNAV